MPYSREIADQRRKYGESLLRRADEQVAAQEQHEAAQEARLTEARRARQEEKERVNAAAEARAAEIQVKAVKLAEDRKKAREEAISWTQEMKGFSDEEKEKRPRKGTKKQRVEDIIVSGDEGPAPSAEGKKRRKGKLKREKEVNGGDVEGSDAEEEALFSADEEDRPKKVCLFV